MKKKTATFVFESTYYTGNPASKRTASVELAVNYESKTFYVKPISGDFFSFEGNSHQSEMWLAIVNSLQKAITFGRMEVGQEPKHEQAPICQECQKSF